MRLRYQNENDLEKREELDNTTERKGRVRELCSKLWDATKKGASVLCFAAGTSVAVNGCGGGSISKDDTAIEEPIEGDGQEDDVYNENDVIEDEKVENVDLENADVEESELTPNCPGPGTPLEGEVDQLIASVNNGDIILTGDGSVVSGDVELTVGAVIDKTNLLILGECPNEPNVIAAFGAQGSSVGVVPQYRLDMGREVLNADLPVVNGELCPPLENDNVPVSKFEAQVNQAIKNAIVGDVRTRAGFSFVAEPLQTKLLVNGAESTSPIILDGSDYTTKWLSVAVEQQMLNMDASIYSNSGEVLRTLHVHGNSLSGTSKILRIFQLGDGNKILPSVNWIIPTGDGPNGAVKMCLRSEDGSPREQSLDVTGEVTSLVVNTCGKIFAGFNVTGLTANFSRFDPPHLLPLYSVSIVGTGLNSMEEGNCNITITLRKDGITSDMGDLVTATIDVQGVVMSKYPNPKTSENEIRVLSFQLRWYDPHHTNYPTLCGWVPLVERW